MSNGRTARSSMTRDDLGTSCGRPDLVVACACLAAATLALIWLIARGFHLSLPDETASFHFMMSPVTALAVLMMSVGIWERRRASAAAVAAPVLAGMIVVALGTMMVPFLNPIGDAGGTGSTDGLGGVLIPRNAALCLLLLGIAVICLDGPAQRMVPLMLAVCGLVLMLALAGHLYGILSFCRFPGGGPMCVSTAAALLCLCVGVLCLRPQRGPVAILFSRSIGGSLARWLLPAAMGVPLLLEKCRVLGQEWGLYSFGAGAALCVVGCVGALCLLTWWAATVIHRLDLQRRQAEDRFTAFMDNSPVIAFIKDEQGRYLYANQRFYQIFALDTDQLIGSTSNQIFRQSGEQLMANDRMVLETGRPVELVEKVPTPQGVVRDWLAFKFPLTDSRGRRCLGGVAVDITERRRHQEKLAEAEHFVHTALDALEAHIAILDEHGTVLAVNHSWEEFGRSHDCADDFRMGVGGDYLAFCDRVECRCAGLGCRGISGCWAQKARQLSDGIETVLRRERDEFTLEYGWGCPRQRSFIAHITRFSNEGPARVVMAHEDVTARRTAEEHVRRQALHDGLTDLPNRLMLQQSLEECIDRASREPGFHYAVLFMDLDRFKVVNDSLGHALGDRLLVTAANKIDQCVRTAAEQGCRIERSMVARMGGDEFIVLLQGIVDESDATRVANRIIATMNVPYQVDYHEVLTTVSIGIAGTAVRYACAGDAIRDADSAMYRAKMAGKGRYIVFDQSMHAEAVDRLQLEGELRRCAENEELRLHYQPIVSLADGRINGFEALVRWEHPDRGLLYPNDFIPLAEETGMIGVIGEWVLRTACRQLKTWQGRFPGLAPLSMSVNLSGRQLAMPGLPSRLAGVLRETGIDPSTLRLEITESMMIDNGPAEEMLLKIKALGVRLHMDDFGTGYSALNCLNRFPLDGMKIDRSFVVDADQQLSHRAVLEAVAGLTRTLGMKLVVEGVETEGQATLLRELNCECAQGYLFATPLESDVATALLETMKCAPSQETTECRSQAQRERVEEMATC